MEPTILVQLAVSDPLQPVKLLTRPDQPFTKALIKTAATVVERLNLRWRTEVFAGERSS